MTRVEPQGFASFFERATGFAPHDYQRRIAESETLPDVIDVPTGLGKTAAIVVGWLWRWVHRDVVPCPRRLVFALPMRTLVEQTRHSTASWLENLGLADAIDLVVLMGGTPRSIANDWRAGPDRPGILIGTVDIVVSKALVRAYATARHAYPMDAALVWNDAHLVIDETQLAAAATTTLRQVSAFQRSLGAAPFGSVGLTCMSATIDQQLLDTVDNPVAGVSVATLTEADDDEDMRRRRAASRTVRAAGIDAAKPKDLSTHALTHHRRGTLTLVIVNTVTTARDVYTALAKSAPAADVVLLHSRFRPADRAPLVHRAVGDPPEAGRIVVSTQVVEAGVDLDAALLVTEASPWSSLIQRVGRCNRAGLRDDAEIHWLRAGAALPYDPADCERTSAELERLEGARITSADLLAIKVPPANERTPPAIRKRDFVSLFDTAADLTGNDLDIAPYIRDSDELDVFVCWADWPGNRPPADLRLPPHEARCAVGIRAVRDYQRRGAVLWRRDPRQGTWSSSGPIRPGETVLVHASAGGYDPSVGFDGKSTKPVPPIPGETPVPPGDPQSESANSADDLAVDCAHWVSLDQHLLETEEEARTLVEAIGPFPEIAADVVLAARLHDVGKAHPTWQDALCRTADADEFDQVNSSRPWAKSARRRRLAADGFRHELASVLALQTSLSALLDSANDRDLVLYLVLAHHGKLRMTVRELGEGTSDRLLGIPDGDGPVLPAVLGIASESATPTSIRQFDLDGDQDRDLRAWVDVTQGLLTRYGPFRLAYLETLVRAADWRASARHSVRGEG